MVDDIRFEAAFLRAALLVGLVHEDEVPSWAEALLPVAGVCGPPLAEILLAPLELAAMRDALAPLADGVDENRVLEALLSAVAAEQRSVARAPADVLRILGHIGREFALPPSIASEIKALEDGATLASAGVPGESAPTADEIAAWLDRVRRPSFFLFSFDAAEQAAAFAAALSRAVSRDRRWAVAERDHTARAWVVRATPTHGCAVVLNEPAWQTAVREFSPVPLGSRIPYASRPETAVAMLEEMTAVPLGAEDAQAQLFGPADPVLDHS